MRLRAFTLVELLVSIGVIALLLGLLAPSLLRARVSAYQTKAVAQIRDIGITVELYLQSERDTYPWHAPGEPYFYAPPGIPVGSIMSSDDPWSMRYFWPVTMHRVAPWPEHYVSWLGARPNLPADRPPWESSESSASYYPAYEYSNSFIGDPACWLPTGNPRPRPMRQPVVRFPSSKALMHDQSRNYLPIAFRDDTRRAVLAADASAALRDDRAALPPTPNRARPGMFTTIYQDTPGGVYGRDF